MFCKFKPARFFFKPADKKGKSKSLRSTTRMLLAGITLAAASSGLSTVVHAEGGAPEWPVLLNNTAPISPNDVSILFPAPEQQSDLANLINLDRLVDKDGNKVWSDEAFNQFIANAEKSGVVEDTVRRLGFPDKVKSADQWYVAGIRVDPGAPGLSADIAEQFGQLPQIRLIAQPVTARGDGSVQIHDITAHLVYNFITREPLPPLNALCMPRPVPDTESFGTVLVDLVSLRDQLKDGKFEEIKVDTSGKPLGIHPALQGGTKKAFGSALTEFLTQHLSHLRLSSQAVMALDIGGPEPWIFLATSNVGGNFVPVPNPALQNGQVAQMLSFIDDAIVLPAPSTNNINPTTCRHAAFPAPFPVEDRKGVSTADIFDGGADDDKARGILARIVDSSQSHFFNTDCVSCHTESTLANRFDDNVTFPNLDAAMLPKDEWNVRNFGWFHRKTPKETVTRRTASETSEVVEFINEHLIKN